MLVIKSISEYRKLYSAKLKGQSIGFVPTMGFLHDGHLSLIDKARKSSKIVVVSIFVNPTQFNHQIDLDKYPRDLKRDFKLCEKALVDVVFCPEVSDIYTVNPLLGLSIDPKIGKILCGRSREGHFEGVLQIVAKLFNIVVPTIAFFGLKDYQQFVLIQRLIKELNYDIQIEGLPIIREEDGLAMSSRNARLSDSDRMIAKNIYAKLKMLQRTIEKGIVNINVDAMKSEFILFLENISDRFRVDYLEVYDRDLEPIKEYKAGNMFLAAAVFIGDVRLIDNILF